MKELKPKFKKGDYINVFVGLSKEPRQLQIIDIFYDRFHSWCYILLSGNHPLVIAEVDLIRFFQAIAIPPDETH